VPTVRACVFDSPASGLMKPKQKLAERQKLRSRIQNAGLCCTDARLAVLHQLRQSTTPLSHADIAATLAPLGYDRATVYRNLVGLSEAGLISGRSGRSHLAVRMAERRHARGR